MNELVSLNITHPKSHLDELRKAYNIPVDYSDEKILQDFIGIVIDDYMNVEKMEFERVQDAITDGNIEDRWQ